MDTSTRRLIRDFLHLAMGAAAGAAAMYWLDPALGRERRAALRGMRGESPSQSPARRMRARSAREAPVDDTRLRDRVRARLDALASHPGAIEVRVERSVVRLSGHVLGKELDGLLFQVREVPGVHLVVNALTPHDAPESLIAASEGAAQPERVQAL